MLLSFIAALVFAFIFSAVLGVAFKRRGPGPANGLFYFFLLILFFSWAFGSWLQPYGFVYWNVSWTNFFIAALFITLFIAVLVPAPKPIAPESKILPDSKEEQVQDAVAITFGFLFWLLIIALALAAIMKTMYWRPVDAG
jgi:hypothetical protein